MSTCYCFTCKNGVKISHDTLAHVSGGSTICRRLTGDMLMQ